MIYKSHRIAGDVISGLQIATDGIHPYGDSVHYFALVNTGTNVTYFWQFPDGSSYEGSEVNHAFPLSQTNYRVTLTATNSISQMIVSDFASFYETNQNLKTLPEGIVEDCGDGLQIQISNQSLAAFGISEGSIIVTQDCEGIAAQVMDIQVLTSFFFL